MTDIQKAARLRLDEGGFDGEPGNTRILQGAPGAGKSSLIFELENRLNWLHNIDKGEDLRIPQVVELEVAEVVDGTAMLRRLAERIDPVNATDAFRRTTRADTVEASVGGFGVGARAGRSRSTEEDEPSALMTAFRDWLIDRGPIELETPVIIAIDEAQNLPPGKERQGNLFLQSVHNNRARLPLSLVLAGLGDTEETANAVGLTRGLTVHSIGRFSRAESCGLMQRWCAHFGLAVGSQRPRLAMYCALADDWPQHLHCAQKALGQAVLDVQQQDPAFDGSLDHLREPDWLRVTAQFAQYRAEHYRGRISQEIEDNRTLTAAVMRSLTPDTTMEDILNTIRQQLGDFEEPSRSQQAQAFRDHLVHQGALQKTRTDGPVICPIPSFRSWLMESTRPLHNRQMYSLRSDEDIRTEKALDRLEDAHSWAIEQVNQFELDRTVSLWHGPVKVEILSDGTASERLDTRPS